MARPDTALLRAAGEDGAATTNLWYARLCKSAARATGGALLSGWKDRERRDLSCESLGVATQRSNADPSTFGGSRVPAAVRIANASPMATARPWATWTGTE